MVQPKEKYTLKEAAAILKISTQTVRRRIDKGLYPATKEKTDFGEVWYISAAAITPELPEEVSSTVPAIAGRQISIAEIQKAFSLAAAAQTQEIIAHVNRLEEKVDAQTSMLDGHYRLVDERLRQVMEKNKERPKPFWMRLFM